MIVFFSSRPPKFPLYH